MQQQQKQSTTPMMKQFEDIKTRYKDEIVFFRLGDFYEMFYDDAVIASQILQITLTKRNDIPMCGIPYHAKDNYIHKLVLHGKNVVICDQLEDPSSVLKGIVKRGVTELITPGTLIDNTNSFDNNFIMAFYFIFSKASNKYSVALSYSDLGTGEFYIYENESIDDPYEFLVNKLRSINPSELIVPKSFQDDKQFRDYINDYFKSQNLIFKDDSLFDIDIGTSMLKDLIKTKHLEQNVYQKTLALGTCAPLIAYMKETKLRDISHINKVIAVDNDSFVGLNDATIRNLELIESLSYEDNKHTLYKCLDHTKTKMGSRLLKQWILHPSLSLDVIEERHNIVEYLTKNVNVAREIIDIIKPIVDIERILAKISLAKVNPKELVTLKLVLIQIDKLQELLLEDPFFSKNPFRYKKSISYFKEQITIIDSAVSEEESINLNDGNVIKDGYSTDLDKLKAIRSKGKDFLIDLQLSEEKKTGIPKIKVKYNKVVGYFLEVSKSNAKLLPDYYIKKQSLVNAERYTTKELIEYESLLLNSIEEVITLEKSLFEELRVILCSYIKDIREASETVAFIDVLVNFSILALKRDYTRPYMDKDGELIIRNARHPIVERALGAVDFIENDFNLNSKTDRILIITGPNMSGKSTYLRQLGLISIMAQMGSYIPASAARLPLIDKIFTRVGSGDNISRGQSTFLVEMKETVQILRDATSRSLILMDEIGRGTSTYDGLSIAWSILEYLERKKLVKVLFATHYHELTELSEHPAITNYCVLVREEEDNIIFLHKVKKGKANRSYGIEAAKLAGMPKEIIDTANKILEKLEKPDENSTNNKPHKKPISPIQADLFPRSYEHLARKIIKLDTKKLSPAILYRKIEEIQAQIKTGD